ncbi:MAG: hypothetical protein K9H64_23805 [Bacteroidales bacterium]|nr:hypothetical protein [Bacteroidales bacterium]MCF8457786.1 hypothetical protein [Bacteroidales bacterium]
MAEKEKISKQKQFFKKIEDIIPATTSMVNELVDLLGVSMDSAYRRLRGETSLTLDEVVILCNHYKISFDSFINLESGNVSFNYTLMDEGLLSFAKYHDSLLKDLKIISTAKEKRITYACEDIPVFHNISLGPIAKFKMFYWMKSILNSPEFEGKQFDPALIPEEFIDRARQIYDLYCLIPSVEIWTDTTIQSTVKQIEFYWESGMFKSKEDALEVCESLKEEMDIVQKQAERSTKYPKPGVPPEYENNYELYFSEIEITNNCVFVNLGETRAVYLGHLSFNTMSTSNIGYCMETEQWLENLKRKSTLISGVAVKHRYQFFRSSLKFVDDLVERIKGS